MSQAPLCPNLSQKVQAEVSQMANRNLSCVILLGGLSVNLNHLKTSSMRSGIPELETAQYSGPQSPPFYWAGLAHAMSCASALCSIIFFDCMCTK